jgi:hypothetical protein
MLAATSQTTPPFRNLGDALEKLIRPAVGFHTPDDVLKDPDLTVTEKRAILSSWASDACAVGDEPQMRWLLGSLEPVPLFEVMDALARLERRAARKAE